MLTLIVVFHICWLQVGQLQESIDLLNRKLSEADAAHQVSTSIDLNSSSSHSFGYYWSVTLLFELTHC